MEGRVSKPESRRLKAARLPVIVRLAEEHHVGKARQAAATMAAALGFEQVPASHVATSVSELAGNLVFHATAGGTIGLFPLRQDGRIGIEVVAEDEGPGIPDVQQAMQDGFSTVGGLGGGLPGVKRLMDEFEITSAVGVGTRIVARKWKPCR